MSFTNDAVSESVQNELFSLLLFIKLVNFLYALKPIHNHLYKLSQKWGGGVRQKQQQ